jgi:Uma2 family endonuclease
MAEPVRKIPPDQEPDWRRERGDPFPYGYRWRRVRLPSGEEKDEMIPLTAQDVLDPQFGDKVPQTEAHFRLVFSLADLLLRRYQAREDVLVLGDVQIYWDVPGLAKTSPDIAVVPGIRKNRVRRSRVFEVAEEGARPCLIIEVVSDSDAAMRRNDYEKKVEIYQRVGVREYLIFDQPFTERGRFQMTGYRLGTGGRYRRIEPDAQGRLLSETTGLLFGVTEDDSLLVADAGTGEPLRTSLQEVEARRAAEAEIARLRAELARRDQSS